MMYKTYQAETLQQAILKMTMDLGKDAIMVGHRVIRKGGFLGLFRKKLVEVTAAAPTPPPTKDDGKIEIKQIQNELSKIRQKIENLSVLSYYRTYPSYLGRTYRHLINCGIDEELTNELLQRLIDESPPDLLEEDEYVRQRLKLYISKLIRIAPPIHKENKKVVVFVGPTGTGKTTTLAKLATHLLYVQKKTVSFVTIDTYRIAAVEQLRAYARILKVQMDVVFTVVDFRRRLKKYANVDYILVDTAGRSQRNSGQLSELKSFLDTIPYPSQVYLTLSASTKTQELLDIALAFKRLPFHKLIFTKLDETVSFGGFLSLFNCIPHGVAYLCTGQNVPEDIEEATVSRLNEYILNSL